MTYPCHYIGVRVPAVEITNQCCRLNVQYKKVMCYVIFYNKKYVKKRRHYNKEISNTNSTNKDL